MLAWCGSDRDWHPGIAGFLVDAGQRSYCVQCGESEYTPQVVPLGAHSSPGGRPKKALAGASKKTRVPRPVIHAAAISGFKSKEFGTASVFNQLHDDSDQHDSTKVLDQNISI